MVRGARFTACSEVTAWRFGGQQTKVAIIHTTQRIDTVQSPRSNPVSGALGEDRTGPAKSHSVSRHTLNEKVPGG